ncbi:MAG: glycosyltransferase [Chitinophagaceae bacterium]|nr:MAG: family 2 glycosyl transferase [Bacteroidetes bacterium OLB11]MCC6447919.1 glycosyltransferase [Chitinophagaceae bacterium]HMN33107.1 glycosyltransferase [Chitinophagaceae bacterium]
MKECIAIVVPAYNPAPKWETILHIRFEELCQSMPDIEFSLYLVNDGSTKNISEQQIDYLRSSLSSFHYKSISTNHGKGYALREVVQMVTEPYVVYTDIDMPFKLTSMQELISQLPNFDLVFGIKEADYYQQLPIQRRFVSKSLQFFIKILFPSLPTSDTQCGLKGMNEKAKEIFLSTKINRYLFDLEFILFCSKNHFKIKPIHVSLREGIVFGNMSSKILWNEFKNLFKILKDK